MMNSSGFMKGMATGLVVGAAVTMITDPISDKQRHKMKKRTNGMFRNIGSAIDTAVNIIH